MTFVRNFEATSECIMSICIETYIFPRWESPKSHESEVGRAAGICRTPADADARAWQLLLTVELLSLCLARDQIGTLTSSL